MDTRLGCRCKYYPYSEYPVWLLLPLQHACVCEPFWYCKHGSTSRCLGRWGWWVFLPASAGWAGSLPETSSPCSVKIPIWSGKKKITNLRRLSPVNKEKKDRLVFLYDQISPMFRYSRTVASCTPPTVSLPVFFGHRDEELSWFPQRGCPFAAFKDLRK